MADATHRAARLLAEPDRWEEVLTALRREGYSKVDSIRATTELLGVPLSDAKRRVHESRAWADRRESDERFQESVLETAAEAEPERAAARTVDWTELWERVAAELETSVEGGHFKLLTEDSIRWVTAVWLRRLGVAADQLDVEVPAKGNKRLDLVVEPGLAAIEFKFPRLPRLRNAPFTQHAGAILADIITVATQVAYENRFAVVVMVPEIEKHLTHRNDVSFTVSPGGIMEIDEHTVRLLPETARRQLPVDVDQHLPVRAQCFSAHHGAKFTVVAYRSTDR